ncbi:MAG TPA: protein phosphatase 2C domain-containing protein [Thermoanaerobaculia bacterium]|nr:protein phosphatase 2C domain-containing protein [Thermoanaerobaculia bacterium]
MLDRSAAALGRPRRLRAAALSDAGVARTNNEDVVLCHADLGLFAVVDGVGGEVAGETGARTAADILLRRLRRREGGALEAEIREATALANNRIFDLAGEDPRLRGMSCVLTVAVVDGERVVVGHVGDSRLYRLQRGRIEKLTRDHSPVGELEDRGELSEGEAMRHPRRNEIYRDVGTAYHRPDDGDFVEVLTAPFGSDHALLLCSDGLTDQVLSTEIRAIVERNAGEPGRAVQELVARANAAGGKDNVSVVLVEGEDYAVSVRRQAVGRDGAARRGQGSEDTQRLRAVKPDPSEARGGTVRPQAPVRGPVRPGTTREPVGRPAPAAAQPERRRLVPLARAGSARAEAPRRTRSGRRLASGAGVVVAVLAIAAGGWLLGRSDRLGGLWPQRQQVLRVGPGAPHATIAAALQAARRGQTVEVEPGVYRERVELRTGVRLRSRLPRAAVLEPRREGTLDDEAAVSARGVVGAVFEGFRVSGAGGVETGLLLHDSTVEVIHVEIVGVGGAAVEHTGSDRSTLRYCHLHENAGAAVRVHAPAAPRLVDNLVRGNGSASPLVAAVEVEAGAAPLIAGNRFEANRGPAVVVPGADGVAEIEGLNDFSGTPALLRVVVAAAGAAGAEGSS